MTYGWHHQLIDEESSRHDRFSLLGRAVQRLVLHDVDMVAEILHRVDGAHGAVSGVQREFRLVPDVILKRAGDVHGYIAAARRGVRWLAKKQPESKYRPGIHQWEKPTRIKKYGEWEKFRYRSGRFG